MVFHVLFLTIILAATVFQTITTSPEHGSPSIFNHKNSADDFPSSSNEIMEKSDRLQNNNLMKNAIFKDIDLNDKGEEREKQYRNESAIVLNIHRRSPEKESNHVHYKRYKSSSGISPSDFYKSWHTIAHEKPPQTREKSNHLKSLKNGTLGKQEEVAEGRKNFGYTNEKYSNFDHDKRSKDYTHENYKCHDEKPFLHDLKKRSHLDNHSHRHLKSKREKKSHTREFNSHHLHSGETDQLPPNKAVDKHQKAHENNTSRNVNENKIANRKCNHSQKNNNRHNDHKARFNTIRHGYPYSKAVKKFHVRHRHPKRKYFQKSDVVSSTSTNRHAALKDREDNSSSTRDSNETVNLIPQNYNLKSGLYLQKAGKHLVQKTKMLRQIKAESLEDYHQRNTGKAANGHMVRNLSRVRRNSNEDLLDEIGNFTINNFPRYLQKRSSESGSKESDARNILDQIQDFLIHNFPTSKIKRNSSENMSFFSERPERDKGEDDNYENSNTATAEKSSIPALRDTYLFDISAESNSVKNLSDEKLSDSNNTVHMVRNLSRVRRNSNEDFLDEISSFTMNNFPKYLKKRASESGSKESDSRNILDQIQDFLIHNFPTNKIKRNSSENMSFFSERPDRDKKDDIYESSDTATTEKGSKLVLRDTDLFDISSESNSVNNQSDEKRLDSNTEVYNDATSLLNVDPRSSIENNTEIAIAEDNGAKVFRGGMTHEINGEANYSNIQPNNLNSSDHGSKSIVYVPVETLNAKYNDDSSNEGEGENECGETYYSTSTSASKIESKSKSENTEIETNNSAHKEKSEGNNEELDHKTFPPIFQNTATSESYKKEAQNEENTFEGFDKDKGNEYEFKKEVLPEPNSRNAVQYPKIAETGNSFIPPRSFKKSKTHLANYKSPDSLITDEMPAKRTLKSGGKSNLITNSEIGRTDARQRDYYDEERQEDYYDQERQEDYYDQERQKDYYDQERQEDYYDEERQEDYHDQEGQEDNYDQERQEDYYDQERQKDYYDQEDNNEDVDYEKELEDNLASSLSVDDKKTLAVNQVFTPSLSPHKTSADDYEYDESPATHSIALQNVKAQPLITMGYPESTGFKDKVISNDDTTSSVADSEDSAKNYEDNIKNDYKLIDSPKKYDGISGVSKDDGNTLMSKVEIRSPLIYINNKRHQRSKYELPNSHRHIQKRNLLEHFNPNKTHSETAQKNINLSLHDMDPTFSITTEKPLDYKLDFADDSDDESQDEEEQSLSDPDPPSLNPEYRLDEKFRRDERASSLKELKQILFNLFQAKHIEKRSDTLDTTDDLKVRKSRNILGMSNSSPEPPTNKFSFQSHWLFGVGGLVFVLTVTVGICLLVLHC